MSRFADIDAVTIDGYGTLLDLHDPVGHLDRALRSRGIELPRETVERGFAADVRHYVAHRSSARDDESLRRLFVGCAAAFLDASGLELDADEFADVFPYEYVPIPGAVAAVDALAARGLALALVANWDHGIHEQLRRHGLDRRFDAIVVSTDVGVEKPDPEPFRIALERLGVRAERAVHVGDHEHDERGAAAAGLGFRPVPLATAFAAWT